MMACSLPEGYSENSDDCDDGDDDNHLGAEEVCDEEDNNCNGEVDENPIDAITYYIDSDGDGFGDPIISMMACSLPEGYVANEDDCNDDLDNGGSSISPTAEEECDELDNNCNGLIDDDDNQVVNQIQWFLDHDEDGDGDANFTLFKCIQPENYVDNSDDCNDLNDTISLNRWR